MEASNVWFKLLQDILINGHETQPRKMWCLELVNYTSKIDMRHPITICPDRELGYRFMVAEAWWILSGSNRVKAIKKYADIARFSDDGYHFDGAYGPRVVDQLRYVADTLLNDTDTRQSVMSIWRPNPRSSKDIPCTLTLQWIVRDQMIHCVVNMRSSDAWLGWPYDVFNFTMITGYVLLLMRESRDSLNWKLGTLYMNVASQHLYGKNWEEAKKIIHNPGQAIPTNIFDPLQYGDPDNFFRELEILKDQKGGALGI